MLVHLWENGCSRVLKESVLVIQSVALLVIMLESALGYLKGQMLEIALALNICLETPKVFLPKHEI